MREGPEQLDLNIARDRAAKLPGDALWRSLEEAEYSARHVTEIPEAVAWFGHISESHGIEHLAIVSADS